MWPFRRRPRFSDETYAEIVRITNGILARSRLARSESRLTDAEYHALYFLFGGANALAFSFLADKGSPLTDLRRDDLPKDTTPTDGYIFLLITMLHVLREQMNNSPEIATAVETSHDQLVSKFSEVTELDESIFTEGLASMDEVAAREPIPNPITAWTSMIGDFMQTMTGSQSGLERFRPPSIPTEAWETSFMGPPAFYFFIFTDVVKHNASLLRTNLGLPPSKSSP